MPDDLLDRKQILLIYLQGSGGNFIQRLLYRIRDNKIHSNLSISDCGDCHCPEPYYGNDSIDIQHYDNSTHFNYKAAYLRSIQQYDDTTNKIFRMHPGDSPKLIDELSLFLPNTKFAIIQVDSYINELKCCLMQIQKWDLSNTQWPKTRDKLVQQFPNDPIIQRISNIKVIHNITYEFRCYLTWMIFLSNGYPVVKFDEVYTTDPNKVFSVPFSAIFENNSKPIIEFISAILHKTLSSIEEQFVSDQLRLYVLKQDLAILNCPVTYLKQVEKIAVKFVNTLTPVSTELLNF